MNKGKCDCFVCNNGFIFEPEPEHLNKIELDNDDGRPLWTTHKCTPVQYVGFTNSFYYCKDCNKQLDLSDALHLKEEKEKENEDDKYYPI